MGFSRQEYQSGLPFLPPGDLPYPGIQARSPVSPALQMDSLPTKPFGKLQQVETSFLFTSSKEELLILCSVLNSLLSVTGLYYPELALSGGLATTSRFLPHPLPPFNKYCFKLWPGAAFDRNVKSRYDSPCGSQLVFWALQEVHLISLFRSSGLSPSCYFLNWSNFVGTCLMACETLASRPRIEPRLSAVRAWSPNHWLLLLLSRFSRVWLCATP